MTESKIAIYRLTALWAFAECGIGGILHAFKLPITGLVVGAISITIISMIRALSGKSYRKNIIQALIVVLIIKASITPHAGITAYIAVAFQGICAITIYSIIPSFSLGTIIHSILSMVESALQKVLVLLVLYGETLLRAIDQLGQWISRFLDIPLGQISRPIIGGYTAGFALWGLMVGIIAIRISRSIQLNQDASRYRIPITKSSAMIGSKTRNSNKKWMVIATLLIALLIFTFIVEDQKNGWILLTRVMIIMVIFYKILGPLMANGLSRLIKRYQSENAQYLQYVLDAIPYTGTIAKRAWLENQHHSILTRVPHFLKDIVMYQLYFIPDNQ